MKLDSSDVRMWAFELLDAVMLEAAEVTEEAPQIFVTSQAHQQTATFLMYVPPQGSG